MHFYAVRSAGDRLRMGPRSQTAGQDDRQDGREVDVAQKSIKLYWNDKTVANGDILTSLFGDRKETLAVARSCSQDEV